MAPFFKLYSDHEGNKENLNKCFSLDDCKEKAASWLENKIFVQSSSPSDIKLDDNLVLNTVFLQIKMLKITLNMENYFIFVINEVSNAVKVQRLIGEKRLLE